MRELAQLVERGLCFVDSGVEDDRELLFSLGPRSRAGEADVIAEREQPLLCAVVKVTLEQAPGGIAGLDDAGAGGPQVMELREQLRLEPLVLHREARGRADVPCELLLGDGRHASGRRRRSADRPGRLV